VFNKQDAKTPRCRKKIQEPRSQINLKTKIPINNQLVLFGNLAIGIYLIIYLLNIDAYLASWHLGILVLSPPYIWLTSSGRS
jgi:hypothetical protein